MGRGVLYSFLTSELDGLSCHPLVSAKDESGWIPKSVWTLRRRQKISPLPVPGVET